MEQPREGPLNIVRVHANGAVMTQKGPIKERLNVRQVTPCVEQTKIELLKLILSALLIREESEMSPCSTQLSYGLCGLPSAARVV
jgi:hypothetical protein